MGDSVNRQRLSAILAADAAGYSRLMAQDEQTTLAALDAARAVFRSQIELHRGRVVDMAGDSVLAVFESAAGAVSAALAVQAQLEEQASGAPADRRMRFRIGVHLGDVIEKADGTVYGDGVNIAARLEGLALPGGVTVSDAVRSSVRQRIAASFEDLGEQQVKNIIDPVRVFRVSSMAPAEAAQGADRTLTTRTGWLGQGRGRWWVAGGMVVLLVAGALAVAWQRPPMLRPTAERSGPQDATDPSGAVAPITMSLAIGAIAVSADSGLPASAGDALREDLLGGIGSVTRHVRLIVVAPTPASGDHRERARQAGARYVVEGDLRANAGQRNAGLRLIDTRRGTQIWSNRFDLPEPAASFEGSVARRRCVGDLASAVENAETARVLAKPLDDLDAMELVVRAWTVADRGQSVTNAREMRKLLDRALALDPTLVFAMWWIVFQLDMLNLVDPHPDHESYVRETDQYSARAVTLDPGDSRIWHHRALALMLLGRWTASLEASDRALQLDPYGNNAYQGRAWLMSMMGRPTEALLFAEKALALDPSVAWTLRVQCEAYLLSGQSDRAITTCERASGLARDVIHDSFLAAAYANAGDLEHARAALQSMLKADPGYTIAQLKAKRFSDHPEYRKIAERYWYDGLRKAGLPEQ